MKSDLTKANMKHIKGVFEYDSMSIFGECSSNELLELFKSKKHARIFIHMLKSLVKRNHDIHNSLCESNSLIDEYKRRNRHLCDKIDCLKRKLHSSVNKAKKNEMSFDGQECLSHACLFVHTVLKVFNSCLWYLDSGCSRHMIGDKSLFKNLKEKDVAFLAKNFWKCLKMKNSGKQFSGRKFSSSKGDRKDFRRKTERIPNLLKVLCVMNAMVMDIPRRSVPTI